jgi:hypothetical protein
MDGWYRKSDRGLSCRKRLYSGWWRWPIVLIPLVSSLLVYLNLCLAKGCSVIGDGKRSASISIEFVWEIGKTST